MQNWFKHIKNRFVIAILIFLVWILFIDENSFLYLHGLQKEVDKLEQKKEYYQNEIKKQKEALNKLNNDKELQEYAREKLWMKKQDEDIYIIDEKNPKK